MIPALRAIKAADRVYRLGRAPDPWAWPEWRHAGPDGTFGNRFDDPESAYRVLYAGTQREAAFRECLARFRPDPAIAAVAIEDNDDDPSSPATSPPGHVPVRWLANRLMGSSRLEGEFCDIGHSDSIAHLRRQLVGRLLHYGLDDLDAGEIRARAPRELTQELSRYVYVQARDGEPTFAGIRYASRLGDDLTNWAIFEPNEPLDRAIEQLDRDDPDLLAVVAAYGLTLDADGK